METIEIKYLSDQIDRLEKLPQGDWIDLRTAEAVELKAGEFRLLPLGVAMRLPEGYEAHMVPRSSLYKKYGILQANHCGIIDNSYCGDGDQWMFPALAMRDTRIPRNERICQFRIQKVQPALRFVEVEHLSPVDRGGFGSTDM